MKLRKYQMGGAAPEAAPVAEGAPAEGGAPVQGGAEEQLAQVAQQLLQMLLQEIGDPSAVAAVLQMALEMLQQMAAGSAEQSQPVFKKGGKLCKCGGKASKMKK